VRSFLTRRKSLFAKPLPAAVGRTTAFFELQQIKVAQALPAQATLHAPRLTPWYRCPDRSPLRKLQRGRARPGTHAPPERFR